MRWLVLFCALAACNSGSATPAAGQQQTKPARPAPAQKPDPGAPGVPELGPGAVAGATPKDTYLKLCAPCHAADGKGGAADHAPSLVNPTFLESASDEFLARSIVFGRPGTSMAGYGKAMGGPLDDASVAGLVKYLRDHGPPPKSFPEPARGDAAAGAQLYNEYCRTCHGDDKVRGEAIHLANARFQEHASDAFLLHGLAKGRPGTKMQAFGAVMTDKQMADVIAHVRALGKAAGPGPEMLPAPTGKEPLVIHPQGKDPAWTPREERFIGVDAVAKALADKRRMIIVDARPPSDWMRVHITGAVSIPYHDPKRLAEVPRDAWVVAYCACPHHLSGVIVDELRKRGHTRALVLDEGINVWHRRGYPVTAAKGVTAPPDEPHGAHDGHQHHGHAHP